MITSFDDGEAARAGRALVETRREPPGPARRSAGRAVSVVSAHRRRIFSPLVLPVAI